MQVGTVDTLLRTILIIDGMDTGAEVSHCMALTIDWLAGSVSRVEDGPAMMFPHFLTENRRQFNILYLTPAVRSDQIISPHQL